MKRHRILLASFMLLVGVLVGCEPPGSYERGWDDGHSAGYSKGWRRGALQQFDNGLPSVVQIFLGGLTLVAVAAVGVAGFHAVPAVHQAVKTPLTRTHANLVCYRQRIGENVHAWHEGWRLLTESKAEDEIAAREWSWMLEEQVEQKVGVAVRATSNEALITEFEAMKTQLLVSDQRRRTEEIERRYGVRRRRVLAVLCNRLLTPRAKLRVIRARLLPAPNKDNEDA